MKRISACLAALALVSCANQPAPEQEPQKAVRVPEPQLKIKPSSQTTSQSSEPRKMLTGKVTFSGWSTEELATFRVIPEGGLETFTPKNQHYPSVDGFWWRGDDQRWFKIPDHATAWVLSGEEKPPVPTNGISENGELIVYWKVIPGLGLLSGRSAGWFPNAGKTRIGAANPFGNQ